MEQLDRYEYRVLNTDTGRVKLPGFEEQLNGLGRDGWRLEATIQRERHNFSHELTFVFVRRGTTDAPP